MGPLNFVLLWFVSNMSKIVYFPTFSDCSVV